jgi:hypothetical protein
MRLAKKWGGLAVALVITVGGCGDDGGPSGGALSSQEKQVLANALAQADDVTGLGGFAGSIVTLVEEVGKLDAAAGAAFRRAVNDAVRLSATRLAAASYDGVGFAIEYDYNIEGQVFQGFFIGVVGWSGINVSANTVDELVMVGGFGEGSTLPSSASGTIEDGDVFAIYWDGSTGFYGTSGSASASPNFSGSSTDCSSSSQGYTFDCSYTTGSMSGDFDFVADDDTGGSYEQTPISFSSLPSLRMSISISD